MMSVHDPLLRKVENVREQTVRLTFSEIEALLGRPLLPASAYRFSTWWEMRARGKLVTRKPWHGCTPDLRRVSLKQRVPISSTPMGFVSCARPNLAVEW